MSKVDIGLSEAEAVAFVNREYFRFIEGGEPLRAVGQDDAAVAMDARVAADSYVPNAVVSGFAKERPAGVSESMVVFDTVKGDRLVFLDAGFFFDLEGWKAGFLEHVHTTALRNGLVEPRPNTGYVVVSGLTADEKAHVREQVRLTNERLAAERGEG